MDEPAETLRERVERIYQYEVTDDPLLLAISTGEHTGAGLSAQEGFEINVHLAAAVRLALFDLAEQLDLRLGSEV